MSEQNEAGRRSSRLHFILIIAVILGGTAFWVLLTVWGAEPVGPTQAKEFARDFERECFLELQDEPRCRKIIGKHHRDCIFAHIERVAPGMGDDGGDIKHDRAGYLTCMRAKTGVQHFTSPPRVQP